METEMFVGDSAYWKAADFSETKKGIIQNEGRVTDSKFIDERTKLPKKKIVIELKVGKEVKELTLNATSVKNLQDALGKNSKQWIGKTVKANKQTINGKDCVILSA